MRHFTKYLLLCLAVCILPNLIGAQSTITTVPGTADPDCQGFDDVTYSLQSVGMCDVDLATVLGLMPSVGSVVVNDQAGTCNSMNYSVGIYFGMDIVDGARTGSGVMPIISTAAIPNFAPGTYPFVYRGTDCTGLSDDCIVEVTIEPHPDQVLDVLACNNQIQASLTADCVVEITSDMMLEGNSPCESGYTFEIEDAATGEILSGTTISSIGTYNVTVFDATGINSCWGTVIAEDYLAPELMCNPNPLDVTCTDDLTPNSALIAGERVAYRDADGVIVSASILVNNDDNFNDVAATGTPTVQDSVVSFTFNPPLVGANATLEDISLELDIVHENITELKAILISADNDTLPIFTNPLSSAADANCLRDDLFVTFEDDGLNDHSLLALDAACRPLSIPAVFGSFKPQTAFSTWNDSSAVGPYTLVITDCNPFDNQGTVRNVALNIRYATGDTIGFPTMGDYTPIAGEEGCYTISNHPDGTCGPIKACFEDEVAEECFMGQNESFFNIVERKWRAWDEAGNMGMEVCTIRVQGSDISPSGNVIWPPHWDGLAGRPFFTCQDIFAMDAAGNPDPSVTGVPMDGGSTNLEFCGNIEMTYIDTRIDICPGSYKLIRNWILIDWCSNGQPVERQQVIKVLDERPPITTCSIVDCHEVPVNDPFTCTASFDIPPPIVLNECGGYTWSVSYLPASMVPGFVEDPNECLQPDNALTAGLFMEVDVVRTDSDNTPITISGLPPGQVWFRYIVVDDCGNASPSGGGACEIRVIDESEPTAVCDEHTTVSIGVDCTAQINALTFDDLSYDSCGDIVNYEASRDGGSFGPTVSFSKSDLNSPVPITLRVTDSSGHTNTCEGEVIVRDKIQPVFTSTPQDVTIDCEFTDAQLQAALSPPTAADNCPNCYLIEMNMGTPNQDECGDGSLQVTWDLFDTNQLDGDGNPLKINSVSQQVTFEDSSPFTVLPSDWPADQLNLTGCGPDIDPSVTGEPNLSQDDACALTAVSHNDLEFFDLDDACIKILREWTVIDFCQFDENVSTTEGIWTHVQVLIINNSVAPTLTNGSDQQFCADESCNGQINIDLIATDDCTPVDEIIWAYSIDYQSDGTIDMQNADVRVDSVLNLGGSHPIGTHSVTVILADNCGNVSDPYNFNIVIQDCIEPTPHCVTTTSVVVLPSTGSVEIWASDFEIASTDQCGGELRFSFSSNPEDGFRTFSCADLRDGVRRAIELQMWVHDESGNSDFCNVTVDLQDNGTGEGACPDTNSPSAAISGFIFTEQNEMVNNVAVQVTSAQPEFPLNFTTNNRGDYTFNNLLTGYTYDITSAKNDDHINGVSTLDIVLIQKHILGLVLLDSPYKIIAADADNNQYVSAADLVSLRKLVLGQIDEFPNGQDSWRFVDEDFTFSNQFNPFPYDEVVNVEDLAFNENNLNFMAVKIGDVNENANPTNYTSHITEVRSNQVLEFAMNDKLAIQGETLSIPVTASNFEDILGFQFTLDFDQSALEFAGYDKAALVISEANLGLTNVDRGLIAISWNDVQASSYDRDEVLFTLEFKVKNDAKISESISINSRITNAEAYSNDLSLVNTKLVFRDANASSFEVTQFELYQNNPNPFNGETSIGFNLADAGEAVLSVYDVTGKMLIRIVEDYQKGYNEVSLNMTDLGEVQGVMYYSLESKGYTATKKMVGVK